MEDQYKDGLNLSEQQRKFCELYATGTYTLGNAWLASGHPCKDKIVAQKAASRLMGTNEDAPKYIAQLRRIRVQDTILTIQEKREFCARVVRACPAEVTPDSDLAQEYTDESDRMKVKLPCKMRALELDSKLAGDFAPDELKVPALDGILQLMAEIRSQA